MNDVVSKTIKKWRQTEFGYHNQNDCLLSLADYLVECGYCDFGAKFRNTFESEQEALNHVQKYGSVELIIDETELIQSENPENGFIVLVDFVEQQIAGIYLDGLLFFRAKRGVISLDFKRCKIVKIWSVEIV